MSKKCNNANHDWWEEHCPHCRIAELEAEIKITNQNAEAFNQQNQRLAILLDEREAKHTALEDGLRGLKDQRAFLLVDETFEYVVMWDDIEALLGKESESKCEHGNGLTDFCEPCGRTHGGG